MKSALAMSLQAAAWMYRIYQLPPGCAPSRFIDWCAQDVRHCEEFLALLVIDARLERMRGMKIDPRLMYQRRLSSDRSAGRDNRRDELAERLFRMTRFTGSRSPALDDVAERNPENQKHPDLAVTFRWRVP